ncbi:MAG: DUF3791 domain-containing protein [Proteobacteria bacterium]|nr:DUF3791 domain-containing protein [Pseudomonadota bacterium]
MGENELRFVVFVIHALSDASNHSSAWIYKVLNDSGILDNYIIPCYNVLHTQGKEYLVEDITEFLEEKGIKLC